MVGKSMQQIVHVPSNKLFVSEPSPYMFGNPQNPTNWQEKEWTNANWLKSRFHKNFAEYRSSGNPPFGVLYVCNDDLVQPRTGFGTHPHREMEIITYIVEGELTHEDSTGNSETLGRGSVQFMSAGTGLYHSEFNHGEKPCRFIQSWITPAKRGLKPNYGSYKAGSAPEGWKHLASNTTGSADTPVKVYQDVDMFAGVFPAEGETKIDVPKGRQAYLVCLEGGVELEGQNSAKLAQHDAAEVYGPAEVTVKAGSQSAHLLLFQMAYTGVGRTDL